MEINSFSGFMAHGIRVSNLISLKKNQSFRSKTEVLEVEDPQKNNYNGAKCFNLPAIVIQSECPDLIIKQKKQNYIGYKQYSLRKSKFFNIQPKIKYQKSQNSSSRASSKLQNISTLRKKFSLQQPKFRKNISTKEQKHLSIIKNLKKQISKQNIQEIKYEEQANQLKQYIQNLSLIEVRSERKQIVQKIDEEIKKNNCETELRRRSYQKSVNLIKRFQRLKKRHIISFKSQLDQSQKKQKITESTPVEINLSGWTSRSFYHHK